MIEFKKFNEKSSSGTFPDLTPLIDMVFLLLIFFLLTSYLSNPAVPVELPSAENTETVKETDPVIVIRTDGSITFNGNSMTDNELSASLKQFSETQSGNRELYIQADKAVPFERIVQIMDISRNSGYYNVSFLVDRHEH